MIATCVRIKSSALPFPANDYFTSWRRRGEGKTAADPQFHQIKDNLLSAAQELLCFYGAMQLAEEAHPGEPSWFAAVNHGDAELRPRRRPAAADRRGRDGTTSLRAIIASSAFLVMFASTTLVGGHAAIDPLLRSLAKAREAKNTGDIVYPMPDGQFCRHLSFDNTTAELAESTVGPCPDSVIRNSLRDRFHSSGRNFTWGTDN
jgi:hypothetical protein